jgi:hypothetical protein
MASQWLWMQLQVLAMRWCLVPQHLLLLLVHLRG